jgi:protein SCO1/2
MNMRAAITLTLVALAIVTLASLTLVASRDTPEHTSQESPLPKIAPAPEFTLTSQDGTPVALADFRGKVVAVTFIYTLCTSTCPVLTPMMSFVQDRLGADFGSKITFVSITVDPERDTPEVLKEYAQAFGANLTGWSFLTGTPAAIRDVARKYGVYASKTENGDVEHTFLTSIIDSNGILRVQYLGVRFDPEEFRRDLLSLKKGQ